MYKSLDYEEVRRKTVYTEAYNISACKQPETVIY